MDRELDGIFFRINRGNGFENICFSDLTESEQKEQLQGRSNEWLKSMCINLGRILKELGDDYDCFGSQEAFYRSQE